MIADELRRIAYQNPFKPFRVKLTNGERFEISRSMRTTVAEDRVLFGVDEDTKNGVARRLRIIPLREIAAVEVTGVNGTGEKRTPSP
jgi:hypothetical protein